LMRIPKLTAEYNVKIGNWEVSKIPFVWQSLLRFHCLLKFSL
jgi:hypothetical protein